MVIEKNETLRFATWKAVVMSTALGLLMYYVLGYGFTPTQFTLDEVSGLELLIFIIVDQFMIEAVYIFLLLKLMEIYIGFFKIQIIKSGESKLSLNLLKLIPFFGLVFFLINPVTQTFRYIIRNGIQFDLELLLNDYLLSTSLYVIYTVFGSIVGTVIILKKLFASEGSKTNSIDRLAGEHEAVMKPVSTDEICYIEIRDRKYWAVTATKELRISKTISELEGVLDSNQFVRISRGVIINLSFVESYSPWESGTYLVELKTPNKREFSISRNRVKEFKTAMKI